MTDTASLTVCTCNLRFATAPDGADAWPRRRERLLDCLAHIDPDMLATQEAMPEQIDAIRARFPHWDVVGQGRFAGVHSPRPSEPAPGEHCAVFFRADRFRLLDTHTRWLSETPHRPASLGPGTDLPRIVTLARLERRDGGGRIDLYNTHFHWGSAFTGFAVDLLGRWIGATPAGVPVVLTGDFNADTTSPEHAALTALPLTGARRLRDVFDERPGRQGTRHDFTGQARVCIDWILASSDLAIRRAWTDTWSRDGRYPSDHFPVVASLAAD
ncbi:MAG: endonuclease/exonuclease/phosphatase family protein [Thiohalocapsa sp.]|jgi:endonuclease/exonuclease/phosphatase family metal-dependent hydrolase|uniref:endonuclease/exonuclease/phosphatase family protein n=1 Tax=Thiohalocapsa sp. TaxID=2497641 RepID=UPI0025D345E8|nr:endonuclease/exonuclease/phosphatase family protein [Thiohalocapsa sp.]MCG6940977.1 endonuclease/exonuclease/phosphatase family protein [Thiohalocapsa sp.]